MSVKLYIQRHSNQKTQKLYYFINFSQGLANVMPYYIIAMYFVKNNLRQTADYIFSIFKITNGAQRGASRMSSELVKLSRC